MRASGQFRGGNWYLVQLERCILWLEYFSTASTFVTCQSLHIRQDNWETGSLQLSRTVGKDTSTGFIGADRASKHDQRNVPDLTFAFCQSLAHLMSSSSMRHASMISNILRSRQWRFLHSSRGQRSWTGLVSSVLSASRTLHALTYRSFPLKISTTLANFQNIMGALSSQGHRSLNCCRAAVTCCARFSVSRCIPYTSTAKGHSVIG